MPPKGQHAKNLFISLCCYWKVAEGRAYEKEMRSLGIPWTGYWNDGLFLSLPLSFSASQQPWGSKLCSTMLSPPQDVLPPHKPKGIESSDYGSHESRQIFPPCKLIISGVFSQ
jgi:hypothetical protein